MRESFMAKRKLTAKKQSIIQTAARLFAEQGFESTTTVQMSIEAGVTEPLIYYHFAGKEDVFACILVAFFDRLFSKLDGMPKKTSTQFEKIEQIISIHFEIGKEVPYETALAIRTCPGKLKDSAHICYEYILKWRDRLKTNLTRCLKAGIRSGEFHKAPVPETVNMLIALINGLTRQQSQYLENLDGVKGATIEFCRRSLIKS
jgi:AcrR family transcriptional regulator